MSEQLMLPAGTQQKRLKDITVKNILDSFRKLGYQNDCYEQFDEDALRRMSFRYSSPEDGSYTVNIEDVH